MQRVYVCFWFDTEDYVTPASDDAALRLARIFSGHGVSATFKVVGEKARRLVQRGRRDVIEALGAHDIGYHTDYHSVHPTVSEYLADAQWEEGQAEFERREARGLQDVESIFGKRCSTYGQPGGSWAPHVYPVLRRWGIPTYVDEGNHIGLNDQPFWYGGVLNVYRMRSRCTRMPLDGASLEAACARFDAIASELEQEGGGLISIYYHPCEWATRGFWDGVNFARGRNTPLDALQPPPLKPEADRERDFTEFTEYLRHVIRSGATLVTCADLPRLYPDLWNAEPLTGEVVSCICFGLADDVTYQPVRTGWASAAEALGVVLEALSRVGTNVPIPAPIRGRYFDGPAKRPASQGPCEVSWADFLEAARGAHRGMLETGRVPSEVIVGGNTVGPASFARAAAGALHELLHGQTPARVEIAEVALQCEAEVREQGAFGWTIFPEGFSAPHLMDLGRLQTWTLKPALLRY